MEKERLDGLYLFVLGAVIFVLFGFVFLHKTAYSMDDFRGVYIGVQTLLEHRDPYNPSELSKVYIAESDQPDLVQNRSSAALSVYLPPTYLCIAPLALVPYGAAKVLWSFLTISCLLIGAYLIWQSGADHAPVLVGGLIAFSLASGAAVIGNANPAGIVVGLCFIAVWCFLNDRFPAIGVLCLAFSLAIKPHNVGLVWLFFLLAGPIHRKRALQALVITVLLSMVSIFWVTWISPNWIPELRSNLSQISVHGANNDPGPEGLTTKSGTMEEIIDLQATLSIFHDEPLFYNVITYLICSALLLLWLNTTVKSGDFPGRPWLALASIAPLTMLVVYHRAYDARLLILAIPACGIMFIDGGAVAKIGLLINIAALIFTGELPLAVLQVLTRNLHPDLGGLFGKIQTALLIRPAPFLLFMMAAFNTWTYFQYSKREYETLDTAMHAP